MHKGYYFLVFPSSGLQLHSRPPQDPRGGPALPQVPGGGAADRKAVGVVHPAARAPVTPQGRPVTVTRTNPLLTPA